MMTHGVAVHKRLAGAVCQGIFKFLIGIVTLETCLRGLGLGLDVLVGNSLWYNVFKKLEIVMVCNSACY
jgi:hypothetical protein